jgi:hypothetical protein
MFVWCECCVLSGRDLRDELITRSEESYRLWCVVVVVCDLETSRMRRPCPSGGCCAKQQTNKNIALRYVVRTEWTCLFLYCFPPFQNQISLPNGSVTYTRTFQPYIKWRYKTPTYQTSALP